MAWTLEKSLYVWSQKACEGRYFFNISNIPKKKKDQKDPEPEAKKAKMDLKDSGKSLRETMMSDPQVKKKLEKLKEQAVKKPKESSKKSSHQENLSLLSEASANSSAYESMENMETSTSSASNEEKILKGLLQDREDRGIYFVLLDIF